MARITANVRKRMKERCGKGSPASIVSGIASAAARETAPRIPAHAISVSADRGGIGSRSRIRRTQQPRQLGRRVDPEGASDEHRQPDGHRPPEQVGGRVGIELVEDSGQLQPDQPEEDRVERERDDLPRRLAHQPDLGRRQLGRVPADVDPDRHGRDHRRDADQLGRDVGEIAREQGDRHLGGREVEPAAHLAHDPPTPTPTATPPTTLSTNEIPPPRARTRR